MRTREDIESELKRRVVAQEWTEGMTHHLMIQLLLDIRELLQGLNPPTMMLRQVEVNADDKGLRSQD